MATKAQAVALPLIAEEGLNVCIWKLMADRSGRTATTIAAAMIELGFDRRKAERRAVALMKQGWFTRRETNHGTKYTLKKGIDMPAPEQAKTEEKPAVETTGKYNFTLDAIEGLAACTWKAAQHLPGKTAPAIATAVMTLTGFSFNQALGMVMDMERHFTNTTPTETVPHYSLEMGAPLPEEFGGPKNIDTVLADLLSNNQPHPVAQLTKLLVAKGYSEQQVKDALVKMGDKIGTREENDIVYVQLKSAAEDIVVDGWQKGPPVPNPQEGIEVCIWKVMCDHQIYTAHEVAEYLEVIGINVHSTMAKFTALEKAGWFNKVEKKVAVMSNVKGVKKEVMRKTVAYTLKLTIDIPPNGKPYKPNPKIAEAARKRNEAKAAEKQDEAKPLAAPAAEKPAEVKPVVRDIVLDLWKTVERLPGKSIDSLITVMSQVGYTAEEVKAQVAVEQKYWIVNTVNGNALYALPANLFRVTRMSIEEYKQRHDQVKPSIGGLHGAAASASFGPHSFSRFGDRPPFMPEQPKPLLESSVKVMGKEIGVFEARKLASLLHRMGFGQQGFNGPTRVMEGVIMTSILRVDLHLSNGQALTLAEAEQLAVELAKAGFVMPGDRSM